MADWDTRRIQAKGQVTLPDQVREKLGWSEATEVSFEVEGESLRVRRAPAPDAGAPAAPDVPLRKDPFVGLWKDREDMRDSTAWVRDSRRHEWPAG